MSHLRKTFFRIISILFVVVSVSINPRVVRGQEGIALESPGADVQFGKSIVFHAKIKSARPILQATLFFQGAHETVRHVENVTVGEDGYVSFLYDASLNLYPPFSEISFWFQATLDDNKTYTSEVVKFPYNDTRFPWRSTSAANVTVHWYAGDDAFGASALDTAGAGMLAMRDFISLSLDKPIDIYIYSNPTDLQSTLLLGGETWIAGHANPQAGVVLVSIPPDANHSLMETQIPHELTHVMMYRALGEKYANQPVWLIEGAASIMELYPNPDYAHALQIASETETLIPIAELCKSFPMDSGRAYLAYAQSQSFVNYIRQTYGISGLGRLMDAYSDGLNCELGATRALSTTLSTLDARWREDVLGQNVTGVAFRNLSPFLLILALVLIVPLWGTIDILRIQRKRAADTTTKSR